MYSVSAVLVLIRASSILVMTSPLALYVYTGGLGVAVIVISVAAAGIYALLIWRWVLEREEVEWIAGRIAGVRSRVGG